MCRMEDTPSCGFLFRQVVLTYFTRALSSAGRASHLQCGGQRFESARVHNSEFEERLTSPAPKARARADVSAKSRQGILNSAKSITPHTTPPPPRRGGSSRCPQENLSSPKNFLV